MRRANRCRPARLGLGWAWGVGGGGAWVAGVGASNFGQCRRPLLSTPHPHPLFSLPTPHPSSPAPQSYFEALNLATCLTQSRRFEHPATRRPLTRAEANALAEHVRIHHRSHKALADELLVTYGQVEEEKRWAALPPAAQARELASQVASNLFASGAAPAAGREEGHGEAGAAAVVRGRGGGDRAYRGRGRGFAPAPGAPPFTPDRPFTAEGNLVLVDDDLFPGHARDGVPANAQPTEAFPALPAPAPPRAPTWGGRPMVVQPVAPLVVMPPAPADSAAAARRRAMAEAFGRGPGGGGSSAFAPSVFPPEAIAFARKNRAFILSLEAALDAFVEV